MSSQAEAKQRFDEVVRRMGWDKDTQQRFHIYLHKNHAQEKDDFSFSELLAVAEDFDS